MKKYKIMLLFLLAILLLTTGYLNSKLFFQKSEVEETEKTQLTSVSICDEVISNVDHKVIEIYEAESAPVNFDSMPEARIYRTTIAEQLASGSNFAGHYTVATWGCGTECQGYAIIDSISGNIVDYKPYLEHQVSHGLSYSLDSNILTLNPKSDNQKYLDSIKGKSAQEMVADDFEAHKARIYYQLIENDDGAYLRKLCVENILDGQF